MKVRLTKLLVLALTVVVLLCGCGEGVQTSTTQSRDGIVAVLTTDKDNYSGLDTAQVALEIINNTGKRVAITTDMKAPEGLKLNLDTVAGSFKMEPGQSMSLSEITVEMDPTGIFLGILIGVLVIAAVVIAVIVIFRKRKMKQVISMLLTIVLVVGLVLPAFPIAAAESEADYASALTIQHPVTVDGKEVVIEAVVNYEIGIPVETVPTEPTETEPEWVDPDCDKPGAKVTAFYYNDFDGEKAMVDKGATLKFNDQKMDIATEGDNGYLCAEIVNDQMNAFYQGDFKNNKLVDNLVVHLDISTDNQIPAGTSMIYRYSEGKSTTLFSFNADGNLVVKGNTYENVKVQKGKWLTLDLVFDLTPAANDLCDVYVNGEKITRMELAKHEEEYRISYMRVNFKAADNLEKTALLDNFIIYESAEILDISLINSPRYPYYMRAREGEDVAMKLPDLANLPDDIIAVVTGTDKAYVNGELVTMSAAAKNGSSGDVFTDAFVPGDFLEKHMGVSGVSADGLYSILRYATGRNVIVDDREFIILSKEPLDAVTYQKELTLLYGYLVTGELTYNYAAAPAWTQSVIDKAVASNKIYWGISSRRSMPALQSMSALYYMVLAAHMDPEITATDGTVVADEAAARIKDMISGGKEPPAEVGTNWEHNIASSAIVLAKNTPAIWNQMTEDDIKRLDLLMECMGIAANWGFNKDNDYKTGFDFYGNFAKNYNPNYRNSYLTSYMDAAMYFGPEKLDEIFVNFDYNSYIARLEEVGFVNILYYWTITDLLGVCVGEYMQNGGEIVLSIGDSVGASGGSGVGVAVPFVFQDPQDKNAVFDSSQLTEIFINSIEYTYSWIVMSSNQAPGSIYYAGTLTGAKTPWEGQMGMMREFSSGTDRSKVEYCYLSAVNIAPLYANMKLLGYWDYDSATPEMAQRMLEMDNRIWVGTEDLFFKMNEGYLGCSQMKQVEEYEYHFNQDMGASYVKDAFMNFHFMKNDEINMATKDVTVWLEEPAEPKDGVTEPPEGAIVSVGKKYDNQYNTEYYSRFGDVGYTSGNVSLDITFDDALVNTDYNAILCIDRKYPHKNMNDSPMRVKLHNGQISITNGSEYVPLGLSFGANYRFHVDITFDVATRKYSGTITQTWPETKKPKVATFNDFDFNVTSREDSYIDALMPIDANGYSGFWVENVQISGKTVPLGSIKTTVETKVNVDWTGVPANVRPKALEVYLVFNGWRSYRTVKLTAANGWTAEFDNLYRVIDSKVIDWGVAVEQEVGKYYANIVKNGRYDYTIKWSDTKYFYNNNFEKWNKGEFVSGNTPIYDPDGNILQDCHSSGKGEIVQGKEKSGNRYLLFKSSKPMQATVALDDKMAQSVYSISMRVKPGSVDASGRLHFSYRYMLDGKSVKHDFIQVKGNTLNVGGHSLAALSPDEWTEFTVVLDFKTLTGEVFCGESTYRRTFELEIPDETQLLIFWAQEGSNICVDNLSICATTALSVKRPKDEANKEAELIVPDTPPAKLSSKYKWYYSADFEYWNKGAYNKSNTPITDAYGNVMIDQWSDSKGPMVRGEEANGNHYLELSSIKNIQGSLFVDEAFDDGTYIVKWRMKLKNAKSVIPRALFSYRYGNNQKFDFAKIKDNSVFIGSADFDALRADKWTEVMVVLNFKTLVGTVCDWKGNKLGTMPLEKITSNLFNIYAVAGTQGLCIDDLQIFSGKVKIIEPPAPPALNSTYEWFYYNDFEKNTIKASDGKINITDPYDNIFADNGDAYRTVTKGGNTYLEIRSTADGQQALVWTNTHTTLPTLLAVKMKMKVAANTSFGKDVITFRYRRDGKNVNFARMLDQKMIISKATGDTTPDMTQWTDVELILNSKTGKCYYHIGDAEGTFIIEQSKLGLQGFMIRVEDAGVGGLYIDDLKIYTGDAKDIEPPAPPALDSNYDWYYSNNFEKGKATAGDGNKNIADPYGNVFVDNGDAYQTVKDGSNTCLEIRSTADGQQALVWTNTRTTLPTLLAVKMKMKVAANTSFGKDVITFRYRRDNKNTSFARMLDQKMVISKATGDTIPDMTQWTDVELILNSKTGKCYYHIGDAEGTFIIEQSKLGLQGFMIRVEDAGVGGLYIDDLKIYTGDAKDIEPPAPPALDSNYDWYYSNNFEKGKATAGDSNKNIADPYGNVFVDNGDAYQTVKDGSNTCLEIRSTADGQQALVWTNTKSFLPAVLAVKMKMKVAANTSFGKDVITFRYRRDNKNTSFARMLDQKMVISKATGDTIPDMTQWTDVELILNSMTGMCVYRIGDAEGTFTIERSDLGLQGFVIRVEDAGVGGLYIDDLQIYTGDLETPDPPVEEEDPTTPPAGGNEEDDPVTPPGGGDEEDTVDMTVTVSWNNRQNPNPPESVKVSLYKEGVLYETVQVTKAEDWKHTFSDLPKYDPQGNRITYAVAVESADIPAHYLSGVSGNTVYMVYTDFKSKLEAVEDEEEIPD